MTFDTAVYHRKMTHYGQNDAREVRDKQKMDELDLNLPSSIWWHIIWNILASLAFGVPYGMLKQILDVVCKIPSHISYYADMCF